MRAALLLIPNKLLQRLSAALIAIIVSGAIPAADGTIAFDTQGGDAWTFDKSVSGHIKASECDEVRVTGPVGSVAAVVTSGRFNAQIPLQSGVNEIHALCQRQGSQTARSDPQRWLNRLNDQPRAWIRVRVSGESVLMDAGRTEPAPGVSAPIEKYEWRARPGNPGSLTLSADAKSLDGVPISAKDIQIRTPATDGEYYVTLRVTDSLGRSDESTAVFQVVSGTSKELDLEEHPRWIDDAVIYGAAPFAFGGSYDDVRKRLPAIAALGVSVIWLSPLTQAAPDDFGYAVTDHFRLRADFGSETQLRALIEAAHALGVRVVMDFVPNHFSSAHRYYADAERNGERSPYYGWFERDRDQPTHYFDWEHLKNLEYDHPEVQTHVLEAFAYWVREFGIDGFRVDVSWGVRDRAPEFWPRWREELKRIDPDLLLIAEASALDGYHFSNGFDVAYDWTSKLGEWAWHDVFAGKGSQPNLDRLREALARSTTGLPTQGGVLRFLNNNDTGARFITRHGIDQTRVAAALLFTLPGLPLVYNGDEVGAQFEPYEEQPIAWRDRHGLASHYTGLSNLRRKVAALRGPELEVLKIDHDADVLAYLRKADVKRTEAGSACLERADALVLLNFSGKALTLRLPTSASLTALKEPSRLEDLRSGEAIDPVAATGIPLEPFQARVLSPCIGQLAASKLAD